jgi:hypothetical protein
MSVTFSKTQRELFWEKLSMLRELITKFEQMNNQKWSTYTRTRHHPELRKISDYFTVFP